MAVLLSIIVPMRNEADTITSSLSHLQTLRRDGVELIVVDGGSEDSSVELAAPLCDKLLVCLPGRAGQMNAGAMAAEGEYLLFLHADTRLPSNLKSLLCNWHNQDCLWGFFRLSLHPRSLMASLVSGLINWRSSVFRIATGDQCLFVRRLPFLSQGGFSPILLMEDVDFCSRFRRLAAPKIERAKVLTSSRRWRRRGWWKTIFLMWKLRGLYFLGRRPAQLHAEYYPHFAPVQTYPDACLLQFARLPRLGRVKTRMQAVLSEAQCLELHKQLLLHSWQQWREQKLCAARLYLSEAPASPEDWIFINDDVQTPVSLQQGGDLGERLWNAACEQYKHFRCLLLVGSDCPNLDEGYLAQALAALAEGCDAVIGPAADGGYVLLGLAKLHPSLFRGIEWGSERVYRQTTERLASLGWQWRALDVLRDVDRPEDLELWPDMNPPQAVAQ